MSDGDDGLRAAAVEWLEQLSWFPIARKEYQDAIRSKGFWILSGIFVVMFVAPVLAQLIFGGNAAQGAQRYGMQQIIFLFYLPITRWFLPIVAIFVGYAAISKERASGSLKILLSQPFSRADVIIGKVIGRCAVAGVTLLVAFVLTAVFLVISQYQFKADIYTTWAALTLLFTLVVVAVSVSISGMTDRSMFSLIGNVVFYLEMTLLWNSQIGALAKWVAENLNLPPAAHWQLAYVLKLINPSVAYRTLLVSTIQTGDAFQARSDMFSMNAQIQQEICEAALNGNGTVHRTVFNTSFATCQPAGNALPLWLTDPAILVYLIAWIGVAAAVSYYTFNQGDL